MAVVAVIVVIVIHRESCGVCGMKKPRDMSLKPRGRLIYLSTYPGDATLNLLTYSTYADADTGIPRRQTTYVHGARFYS